MQTSQQKRPKCRASLNINVVEKVLSLKEQEQEFLTSKSLAVFLGGVSKDFIKDLRESEQLPIYRLRNTFLYKVKDVMRLIENNRVM